MCQQSSRRPAVMPPSNTCPAAVQTRALEHPKIEPIWNSTVVEAYGNEQGMLGGLKVQHLKTGEVTELHVGGLFFAIGHEPASKFLGGQVKTDEQVGMQ